MTGEKLETMAGENLEKDRPLLIMRQAEKWIEGRKVISQASLKIDSGKIIGVVGDNGDGKTVLLNLMAGLMKPDGGEVLPYTDEISFVLSGENFYPWMKVQDALKFYQDFYEEFDIGRAQQLLGESEIAITRKISHLSKGEQERVCLILALCRRRKLYLMDEPLSGIDPYFKKDFRKFLLANLPEDSTVVMVTHLLRELEYLFDEILFVTPYRIRQMEAEEIRSRYHRSVEEYYLEVIRCEKV